MTGNVIADPPGRESFHLETGFYFSKLATALNFYQSTVQALPIPRRGINRGTLLTSNGGAYSPKTFNVPRSTWIR